MQRRMSCIYYDCINNSDSSTETNINMTKYGFDKLEK